MKNNPYRDAFVVDSTDLKRVAEDLVGSKKLPRNEKKFLSKFRLMSVSKIGQNQKGKLTMDYSSHTSKN